MHNILVSDIGGTNCRFFCVQINPDKPLDHTILHSRVYKTASKESLEQATDCYLKELGDEIKRPNYFAIAIAGAPKNNKILHLANIPWESGADGNYIAEKFGFMECKLMNDFEAVGYAALNLNYNEFVCLQKSTRKEDNKLVIAGLGTGLGVCSVIHTDNPIQFKVVPSESGHLPLGITNREEYEYERFVAKELEMTGLRYTDSEYLVCGKGIPYLFKFIHRKVKGKDLEGGDIDGKAVTELLKKHEDIRKVFLEWFCKILGRIINNLIKLNLVNGGKIILGGIVYIYFDLFFKKDKGKFFDSIRPSLYNDSIFGEIIEKVSIYIYPNDNSVFALDGAINYKLLRYFSSGLINQLTQKAN